ncbi:MAG: glutamine-hydrolyzing GMP synthase, partial [Actinomycetota bacterium]
MSRELAPGQLAPEQLVLVVDFGAQYAQLIARRVREAKVFSEIVAHTISAAEIEARKPAAIILSGGPKSVHVEGAPKLDSTIYELGVPILGICYGAQLIAQQLGGEVARSGRGEYGRTAMRRITGARSTLLLDSILEESRDLSVWMSHFDSVTRAPEGFVATAATPDAPMAVIENPAKRIWGVQFHPEVMHTQQGTEVLRQFIYGLADCKPSWTMDSIIDTQVADVRRQVGGERV